MSCVDNYETPGKAPQRRTRFHPCRARRRVRRSRKILHPGEREKERTDEEVRERKRDREEREI